SVPVRNRPVIHAQSLLRKLDLRNGHPLLPWVKAELEDRFDLRCCETIEDFQATADWAMTRQRHIKWRGERHEKDDRERTADPRNFVLGWDNREKRRVLAEGITRLTADIEHIDGQINGAQAALSQLRAQLVAVGRVKLITDFSAIDFGAHAREKDALEGERKSLEDNNEAIRTLRERVKDIETECGKLETCRDDTVKAEERTNNEIKTGRQLISNARTWLTASRADGSLARHLAVFGDIQAALANQDVTVFTVIGIGEAFKASQISEVSRLRGELTPLTNDLLAAMNSYLRQFPDERADLTAGVEYVDSFGALHEQIRRDDLPRHEARFKEHMNEKVIHEIGLLNGAFQSERTEIVSKIDLLNQSLRQLEYRPGTFMRLEPREVRDREIQEFRDALKECLSGTFEGTLEADEARYMRIEKFLARLRDETRWCEKVTDVRRWFDFVARELDVQTERERAYYEDSAGQSGGEKAKLAFTILVAAIAYQYDLDPTRPASDRFRFVVVDEMFSKVDDQYSEYALALFKKFGLQLLIVAPLDSKARVTESHVGCYLHVAKDAQSNCSEIFSMTAREFDEAIVNAPAPESTAGVPV
ncbi:MAG: SbcC/MukB-like Walker B domain-containing protein, partial [Phycisphaerae bacterium]